MPRVAIVHDFLMQRGGAEKVVEVLHEMYPDAPIYTSAFDRDAMPAHYRDWDFHTTFLQRLPLKRRTHRAALLLYPAAFESFDLSNFDLVISSSSWFAKGVITQPHTTHICYTHTLMRLATIEAIERADKIEFNPAKIRAHAQGFDRETFKARMGAFKARVSASSGGSHFADGDYADKTGDRAGLIPLLPRRTANASKPANGTSGRAE